MLGNVFLRLHRERFDAPTPAGNPASGFLPFRNPLRIYHVRHLLHIAFARIPHGGIPAKRNACPERKLNAISGRFRTSSERSDARFSIALESVRLRQERPVPAAADEGYRQRRKGGGIPARRLKTLPELPLLEIYLYTYMLFRV